MNNFCKIFILGLNQIKKWVFDGDHFCAAVFIVLFSLYIPYALIKCNNLNNYRGYAVGVIYKTHASGKGSEKNFYEFWINNTRYYGQEPRGVSNIRVGDSVFIEYDRTDPKNNEIVGYFEYALDRSKLPDTVFYRRQMNSMRKPME